MSIMPTDEATELQAAFARYRTAQAALRGHRNPPLADVEAALEARVELFRCLVESGWQPPEPVARQINLDAALVEQPHGALGG
ncbi:MAG: hypothetical protein QOJ79_2938 [Actinomycetota bacterium]|jgi:hypothetical protein|nr:hypothetical protein [Actinomycetota bacterium]